MIKVFDAYAVLCWMQEEPGASYIEDLMEKAEKGSLDIRISAINIGEVVYRLIKVGREQDAALFMSDVTRHVFPWKVMPATNARVWVAARLKGRYSISYADAFVLALANETRGEIVTRDPEILEACEHGGFTLDPFAKGDRF